MPTSVSITSEIFTMSCQCKSFSNFSKTNKAKYFLREKQLTAITTQVEELNSKLMKAYEEREELTTEKEGITLQLSISEDRFKEQMTKKEQLYNFMNDLQDLLMVTNNSDKDELIKKNKGMSSFSVESN